jgi:hypothetical protein
MAGSTPGPALSRTNPSRGCGKLASKSAWASTTSPSSGMKRGGEWTPATSRRSVAPAGVVSSSVSPTARSWPSAKSSRRIAPPVRRPARPGSVPSPEPTE